MNIFLEKLKLELDYRCMTQKELAEKTDISVNTIRGWFSKNLTPDVFSAVKIAKVLDVSVEYLADAEYSTNSESNIYKQKYETLVSVIQNQLDKQEKLIAAFKKNIS